MTQSGSEDGTNTEIGNTVVAKASIAALIEPGGDGCIIDQGTYLSWESANPK